MRGPWLILTEPDDYRGHIIGPEKYTSIAEVRNGAEDEEYGGTKYERANAAFIASSRTLLPAYREALACAVEALDNCFNDRHEGDKVNIHTLSALNCIAQLLEPNSRLLP